nr:MAG: hypothetical protein [Microviridae sp.]
MEKDYGKDDVYEGAQEVERIVDLRKSVRYGPDFHPQYEGEWNSGESITEQTYVPIEEQIKDMIRAGEFLEEYRRARWDFGPDDEVDENVDPDPTLGPGWDPADAYMQKARLMGKRDRLLAQEAKRLDAEAKAEADKLSTNVDAGGEAPVSPVKP